MKIFISHKKEDETTALNVQKAFANANVDVYLDILDDTITGDGENLTKHICEKLRECTHVIVILSYNTKFSWWVPFEIGVATEKEIPIVNYLINEETLPEYLEYWPCLRNEEDIPKYIEAVKESMLAFVRENGYYQFADNRMSQTQRFYVTLKEKLAN